MKELKSISWNISESEYRQDKALSYSTLAKYVKEGFKALRDTTQSDTPSLRFGSLIDCLITEPETFTDRFYISKHEVPSSAIANIIEKLYAKYGTHTSDIYSISRANVLNVIDDAGYYPNWKEDTRINKVIIEGGNYYTDLCLRGDKTVISEQDFIVAKKCIDELQSNPYTAPYIINSPEKEHCYQLKFKLIGKYNVRCMFDKIIVDHTNKTIQPLDLKTSSLPEEEFVTAFWKWKYYIQASLYTYILQQVCNSDDYFKDFTILPFKFVVICKTTLCPLVWEFNDEEDFYLNKNIKHWTQLHDEVKYYLDNPQLKYSKETLDNNGLRKLNILLGIDEPEEFKFNENESTI